MPHVVLEELTYISTSDFKNIGCINIYEKQLEIRNSTVVIVNWFPRGASRYGCYGDNNNKLKCIAKLALIFNKLH